MWFLNNRLRIVVALVILFNVAFAGMCGRSQRATIATATDDFAEAQISTANLLASAKTSGLISQEDVNEIKPFLLQANSLNEEAIAYGRSLSKDPNNTEVKNKLVERLNLISAALTRANNAGLLRIKDPKTRAAFSTLIVVMQSAATSIITLVKR